MQVSGQRILPNKGVNSSLKKSPTLTEKEKKTVTLRNNFALPKNSASAIATYRLDETQLPFKKGSNKDTSIQDQDKVVEKQVHVETLHLGTLNFEEPRKSAQPFGHPAV